MKRLKLAFVSVAFGLSMAGSAQAQLLGGVVQTFPDFTLNNSFLIYDNNGIDADTGLLRVVSISATLSEGRQAGGTTDTQSYVSATDMIPDVTLSFQIANGRGRLAAGSFEAGVVSIGFGLPANEPRYSWQGAVTNFGFQPDGRAFNAIWNVTSDQYQNIPSTLSQFTNGFLTGGRGGIIISNSTGFGTANFGNDWVFGTGATSSTLINSYLGGLTNPLRTNSTVFVDVFASPVPELDSVWMMAMGLAVIVPVVRRRRKTLS